MGYIAGQRPQFFGKAGAPAATDGIITAPEGGTYSHVRVGDVYVDTATGTWYVATATDASSVTWTVLGTQV